MKTSTRKLRVTHATSLFTDILSSGMYRPDGALMEPVKNGLDALRRQQLLHPDALPGFVRVELLKNHPLCPDDIALAVTDTGTGLTDVSLRRYLTIGAEEGVDEATSFGQKRIGRIAAFALMQRKHQKDGYWVLSATSAQGPVMMMRVSPAELAAQELEMREIPRDDSHLAGRCPEGSFTTILIPHVIPSMRSEKNIVAALEWQIPRYRTENGFRVYVGQNELIPPPLATTLIIHYSAETKTVRVLSGSETKGIRNPGDLGAKPEDLVLFAGKTEENDRRGLRFCCMETGIQVAHALRMVGDVPFPMGKTEIDADLFVPGGVIRQQNTARNGFSPEFLSSPEWRCIVQILIEHFAKPISRLIGDDTVLRDDPLGRTMRNVLRLFARVYGQPDKKVPAPSGVTPPPGFEDEEEGEDEPERGDKPIKERHPHKRPAKRRASVQRFNYKGTTYLLGVSREAPNVAAVFYGPNLVCLNTRDVMTTSRLRNAPAALRLYVITAIVRCIERQVPEHELNAEACDIAVQEAMLKFYQNDTE